MPDEPLSALSHLLSEADKQPEPAEPVAPVETPPDATVEEAPEPAEAATETDPEPTEAATEEEYDAQLAALFAERFGLDVLEGGKYKSASEGFKSLIEAKKLVGRRNEEAEVARLIRGRETEFMQWLQDRQAPKPAETPPAKPETPERPVSRSEYMAMQQAIAALGDKAPADLIERYNKTQERLQEVVWSLVENPESLVRPVAEKLIPQHLQQQTEQQAQAERVAREAGWLQQFDQMNATWLYDGGAAQYDPLTKTPVNLTTAGQQWLDMTREAQSQGVPIVYAAELAYRRIHGEQQAAPPPPPKKPTLPVKPSARRTPAIAAASVDPNADDLFGENPGEGALAAILAKLHAKQ